VQGGSRQSDVLLPYNAMSDLVANVGVCHDRGGVAEFGPRLRNSDQTMGMNYLLSASEAEHRSASLKSLASVAGRPVIGYLVGGRGTSSFSVSIGSSLHAYGGCLRG
jgi:hypothetical protein